MRRWPWSFGLIVVAACSGDPQEPGAEPGPPLALSAVTGYQTGEVILAWLEDPQASSYNLYWSASLGVTPATGHKIEGVTPPYFHTALPPNQLNSYIVTAVRGTSEGPPSREARATVAGDVRLTVVAPSPLSRLADSVVPIRLRVGSTYQLSRVAMTVSEHSTDLTSAGADVWEGNVSLLGLPPGEQQLSLTVTQAGGEAATSTLGVLYDRHARLTVLVPEEGSAVQGALRLAATCEDDLPAGCTSLTVTLLPGGALLASATDALDELGTLPAFTDGAGVTLSFRARDTRDQVTEVRRNVLVDLTSGLTEVARAEGGGAVIDASAERLLVARLLDATALLLIQDRATGDATTIFSGQDIHFPHGSLTPDGALFEVTPGGSVLIREWRNGGLVDVGETISEYLSFPVVRVAGTWAVWAGGRPGLSGGLFLRDLIVGTDAAVTPAPGFVYSVGANGDVVYGKNSQIFRYRNGVGTPLTSDDPDQRTNQDPLTDGVNVVYRKREACCGQNEAIAAHTASGEIVLAPATARRVDPHFDYAANNGWIAYTKPAAGDPAGVFQVWTRSPTGEERQVSALGASSFIEVMGPGGEVVFFSQASGSKRRYLALSSASPRDISSGLGRPVFIGSELHLMIGSSLLRVD